jgi:hypothetical protein
MWKVVSSATKNYWFYKRESTKGDLCEVVEVFAAGRVGVFEHIFPLIKILFQGGHEQLHLQGQKNFLRLEGSLA